MNDRITAGAAALTAAMVGATAIARMWPTWERSPLPVPDVQAVDFVTLEALLDGGEVEANDFAWCWAEQRTTFHALRGNGSRRCWTCSCESPAGAS